MRPVEQASMRYLNSGLLKIMMQVVVPSGGTVEKVDLRFRPGQTTRRVM